MPVSPAPQPMSYNLLDWILAFLPILAVLILMLRFRWGGSKAGAVGWGLAIVISLLRFGIGWSILRYAQLMGLMLTLYVLLIIWTALLFFRVTDEAGAVETIGAGLPRLTPDRGLQALLLGWVFSSFLQGMGGFGVPVAVVAPLLIGLGFPPMAAIIIPSVGHPWAVTFGSLGLSFFALIGATGLPGDILAPWCAILLGLACLGCGAGTLWAAGGKRTLRANFVELIVLWLTMAGVQYIVVTNGLHNIGSMMAGLVGLGVGVALARLRRGRLPDAETEHPPLLMPLGWAMLPYGLLVGIVLFAQIPALNTLLNQVVVRTYFPELQTARGWITPAEQGRSISIFGHAGSLLIYASLVTYFIYRKRGSYKPGAIQRIARGVSKRALRSSLGTAAMVGMALTMQQAGMTYLLADGIAKVAGPAFPVVSPFIGVLGAFMTGSNTNSNVIFADLQQQVATLLGLSPWIILAAQTTGGAIGSAFAPAKVIVGCSTCQAEEGPVLKAVMRYGMLIVAGVAVATVVALVLSARLNLPLP